MGRHEKWKDAKYMHARCRSGSRNAERGGRHRRVGRLKWMEGRKERVRTSQQDSIMDAMNGISESESYGSNGTELRWWAGCGAEETDEPRDEMR